MRVDVSFFTGKSLIFTSLFLAPLLLYCIFPILLHNSVTQYFPLTLKFVGLHCPVRCVPFRPFPCSPVVPSWPPSDLHLAPSILRASANTAAPLTELWRSKNGSEGQYFRTNYIFRATNFRYFFSLTFFSMLSREVESLPV